MSKWGMNHQRQLLCHKWHTDKHDGCFRLVEPDIQGDRHTARWVDSKIVARQGEGEGAAVCTPRGQ